MINSVVITKALITNNNVIGFINTTACLCAEHLDNWTKLTGVWLVRPSVCPLTPSALSALIIVQLANKGLRNSQIFTESVPKYRPLSSVHNKMAASVNTLCQDRLMNLLMSAWRENLSARQSMFCEVWWRSIKSGKMISSNACWRVVLNTTLSRLTGRLRSWRNSWQKQHLFIYLFYWCCVIRAVNILE